ncbi:GNAT family N-acetyltransferase [Paenibacillus sp. CN-4]|uniref:GNAT family N-acetyltransferase n=1 Tax=Paenibacillus nanchangensis TaxID=3348343 RepID=UPI003979484F
MNLRLLQPGELDAAARLADEVFRDSGERSMRELFPPLFDPGISESYGAFDEDETLAAFMGLVPFGIQAGTARLRTYAVGSVCTGPLYRGRGLASGLLRLCREHASRAGAALLFVSGDRSLYTRAGCVPFGQVHTARLPAGAFSEADGWEIRPMEPADLWDVRQLLASRAASHELGHGELARLLGAGAYAGVLGRSQRCLVAARSGAVQAFAAAALTRTPDEPGPGTALEWAGPADAVARLLGRAAAESGGLDVPVPWQERELLQLLAGAGASVQTGPNSGTAGIASRGALLQQVSVTPDRGGVVWAEGLDDAGLLSLLFDPDSPLRRDYPNAPPALPLPYMSGLAFI